MKFINSAVYQKTTTFVKIPFRNGTKKGRHLKLCHTLQEKCDTILSLVNNFLSMTKRNDDGVPFQGLPYHQQAYLGLQVVLEGK